MNPLAYLAEKIRAAQLSEPVRLWIYGFGSIIAAGFVLAGWLTEQWSTFLLLALAQLLAVPAAELSRLSVYAPRGLLDAGVLRDTSAGRHAAPDLFAAARADATPVRPSVLRSALELFALVLVFALTVTAVAVWTGPFIGLPGATFAESLPRVLIGCGTALVSYAIVCALGRLGWWLLQRIRAVRARRRQLPDLTVTITADTSGFDRSMSNIARHDAARGARRMVAGMHADAGRIGEPATRPLPAQVQR